MSDIVPLKQCKKCGEWKPATYENFQRTKKGTLSSPCRQCIRKHSKEYRDANPDKVRESQRKFNQSEKRKLYLKDYNSRNPDRIKRAKARYRSKGVEKRYLESPESRRHKSHIRRARQRDLPADFTLEQWQQCLEYWGHKCCICGRSADFWHHVTRDHWIPIADKRPDNPGTVAINILPLCHSVKGALPNDKGCNNSKHKRDPVEWLTEKLGKRKAKQKLAEIQAYFDSLKPEE